MRNEDCPAQVATAIEISSQEANVSNAGFRKATHPTKTSFQRGALQAGCRRGAGGVSRHGDFVQGSDARARARERTPRMTTEWCCGAPPGGVPPALLLLGTTFREGGPNTSLLIFHIPAEPPFRVVCGTLSRHVHAPCFSRSVRAGLSPVRCRFTRRCAFGLRVSSQATVPRRDAPARESKARLRPRSAARRESRAPCCCAALISFRRVAWERRMKERRRRSQRRSGWRSGPGVPGGSGQRGVAPQRPERCRRGEREDR